MKILIDARSLGSKPSGIGIYIYNFVKELVRYKDMEISLITDVIHSKEMKTLSDTLSIYSYDKKIRKNLGLFGYYRFVQKTIHKVKPDIFWEGNNMVPVTIKNPYGKFITTIHDMFPITMAGCYGRIYPYYFRYGMKKTIQQVDAILYNSEETKKETEKYFPAAKNISSFISYIVVDCIKKTELTEEDYFFYIGNLEKRKGIDILFRAYREYRKNGGKMKLRFAGKFREDDIEELYNDISKEISGLEYVGYADEEEKDKLLAGCSGFVFPSRAEGFGIPVIEALIYGKKVLVSSLSIYDEIVGDAVEYVDCKEENAVVEWARQMQELETKKERVDYTNPYTAEELGKKLYEYFNGK